MVIVIVCVAVLVAAQTNAVAGLVALVIGEPAAADDADIEPEVTTLSKHIRPALSLISFSVNTKFVLKCVILASPVFHRCRLH